MHTSDFGMDCSTWSNSLTVAGEITRSTDSIISKYPFVSVALSTTDRSTIQGARICIVEMRLQLMTILANY